MAVDVAVVAKSEVLVALPDEQLVEASGSEETDNDSE